VTRAANENKVSLCLAVKTSPSYAALSQVPRMQGPTQPGLEMTKDGPGGGGVTQSRGGWQAHIGRVVLRIPAQVLFRMSGFYETRVPRAQQPGEAREISKRARCRILRSEISPATLAQTEEAKARS
jgi:hypothetical protein